MGARHAFVHLRGPAVGSRQPIFECREHDGEGQEGDRQANQDFGGPIKYETPRCHAPNEPPSRSDQRGGPQNDPCHVVRRVRPRSTALAPASCYRLDHNSRPPLRSADALSSEPDQPHVALVSQLLAVA